MTPDHMHMVKPVRNERYMAVYLLLSTIYAALHDQDRSMPRRRTDLVETLVDIIPV